MSSTDWELRNGSIFEKWSMNGRLWHRLPRNNDRRVHEQPVAIATRAAAIEHN